MTADNHNRGNRQEKTVEVALYVRSLSPPGACAHQRTVVDRLETLESNGTVDEYTVEVWGSQLATSDATRSGTGRQIFDRIEQFRSWAKTHGRSIESFFATETVRSKITDEEYTRVVFPTMTLAEYVEGELRFVSPSNQGEAVTTVADRLDAIEATVAETPIMEVDP